MLEMERNNTKRLFLNGRLWHVIIIEKWTKQVSLINFGNAPQSFLNDKILLRGKDDESNNEKRSHRKEKSLKAGQGSYSAPVTLFHSGIFNSFIKI